MVNRVFLLGLLISTVSIPVLAQSTFFGAAPAKPTTSKTSARTVMSPADFNSQVTQITTKKQAAFKEQLNQQLAQPLPPTPGLGTTKQPTAAAPATPPPPVTAPTNRNVYTGFGSGGGASGTTSPSTSPASGVSPTPSSTPDSTPAPSGGGGGWNIRY